jgi:hypothetical protein
MGKMEHAPSVSYHTSRFESLASRVPRFSVPRFSMSQPPHLRCEKDTETLWRVCMRRRCAFALATRYYRGTRFSLSQLAPHVCVYGGTRLSLSQLAPHV